MTTNQIRYQELLENQRKNRATERETQRSNLAKEVETNRSNIAKERGNMMNLAETQRSNLAREEDVDKQRTLDYIKGIGGLVNDTAGNVIQAVDKFITQPKLAREKMAFQAATNIGGKNSMIGDVLTYGDNITTIANNLLGLLGK